MKQSITASLMRSINRSAVLELLRHNSPIARTRIAEDLEMSLPTVMRIVDGLIEEDLVRATGNSERTGGRRRPLLQFNGNAHAVVGVDLGGVGMFGAVADLSGNIQHETHASHEDTPECSVECLIELIQSLLDAPRPDGQRIRGIGIGAPGVTLRPDGVVIWSPSMQWQDLPLNSILADHFDLPVFVDNDVNLATLGEWEFGIGQGSEDLVCFYVGRGIGSGIMIGDVLYRGHNQAAGEIGYLLPGIEFLGRRYDNFGALEDMASITSIIARAHELMAQEGISIPAEGITVHDILAAARQGETWARQLVDETVKYLALAIAAISSLLNPELIILSGTLAGAADLFIEPISEYLEGVVPFAPKLLASSLEHRAVVLGAVTLVLNRTGEYFVVKQRP